VREKLKLLRKPTNLKRLANAYSTIWINVTTALINIISDKQGFIKSDAFFQLIKLQAGIALSKEDTELLKQLCSVKSADSNKNIMYKEALKQI